MHRGDLITHVMREHSLECKRCHKRFLSVCYLAKHIENISDCQNVSTTTAQDDQASYVCRFCTRTFEQREKLANHARLHHEDGEMTDVPYPSPALTLLTQKIAEEGKKPVTLSSKPVVRYALPYDTLICCLSMALSLFRWN